ncbi:MAG: FtsX-like permease family protein [Chitinivibrionales bacterium]|nr:FtsX-like permease family protein [Chitinivibrionales bacterium]
MICRRALLLMGLLGMVLHGQDSTFRVTTPSSKFYADITTLASGPHRLSGTPEAHVAGRYIERRLRKAGIEKILKVSIPLVQIEIDRCEISVGDTTVALLPVAPNLHVLPATPAEGLRGPMVYMGDGSSDSVWNRKLDNSIAVFEYKSRDRWVEAFSMGAKAVIFLGDTSASSTVSKRMGLPANLIRLYADENAQAHVDFRKNHDEVVLYSHLSYTDCLGENIIGFIPGTNPDFVADRGQSELMVLSANYDSYGQIPHKSPAARSAGNVAALLQAAEYFVSHRPKRDLALVFCDNQANFHQGMRAVYDAITKKTELRDKLSRDHTEEYEYLLRLKSMLSDDKPIQDENGKLHLEVKEIFFKNAEFVYADLNQAIMKMRLREKKLGLSSPDSSWGYYEKLELKLKWSTALEKLNKFSLQGIDPQVRSQLKSRSLQFVTGRIEELDVIRKIDRQEKELYELLGNHWIVLHTCYNFSDRSRFWGAVVGDKSEFRFYPKRLTRSHWDNPGWYRPVMAALQDAAFSTAGLTWFNTRALTDPLSTGDYVPGEYVCGSIVAGINGFYNISFMTHHDGRLREGHPSDNLRHLNWRWMEQQAEEAHRLLFTLANSEDMSLPQAFQSFSITNEPKNQFPLWSKGRPSGFFAGRMVSGSLTETRPAAGAIIAICATGQWELHGPYEHIPGFNRFAVQKVNANGNYKVTGFHSSLFDVKKKEQMRVVPALFDSTGQVHAIINDKHWRGKINRVSLFPAQGYIVPRPLNGLGLKSGSIYNNTKILKASANAVYREDRVFYVCSGLFTSFYCHRFNAGSRVKLFQKLGAVCLGASPESPYGEGVFFDTFISPPPIDRLTAEDLWRLNETRLSILRSRGVIDVDLEVLHNRAKRAIENANEALTVKKERTLMAQSAALSRKVYAPVKEIMNDLIQAIVVLLLLAIPFAFAIERLIICATGIYTRIAGFVGAFLVTFLLLYFMHPGFSIASTPLIVFLAFVIIVLSSLVIFIMMRKFKTELMAFQLQSTAAHNTETSRMGTLMAAMSMGMSTMRRRPTRTMLTCITVIILTFTVLCFASFGKSIGVQSVYEGPVTGEVTGGFFMRKLDYSKLSRNFIELLKGREGKNGFIAGHWWKVKDKAHPRPVDIARVDNGSAITVDAVLGLASRELELWPQLAEVLGGDSLELKQRMLKKGGVFLPSLISDEINLTHGDSIWFGGHKTIFAGSFDIGKLQKTKHLDGRSVLPVDFADERYDTLKTDAGTGEADAELVQRDFVRLSGNQTAIVSDSLVRRLGGNLHTVVIYPDKEIDIADEGSRLAEMAYLPVWIRSSEGIKRLIFAGQTGVEGAFALLIPVLLGGFIIFGTLLGSIADREKEIYTFSALGLSPGHVGFLFLAEAGIYAIVGGMGGQLLAQAIALGASFLADLELIHQPSINFSSSNSIFAIVVVMITVLASAIYPAWQASKSANPGINRGWKMPAPEERVLRMKFPFTVSRYDLTGVVSFLAEHFREHEDAGIGVFAASDVTISREKNTGNLVLSAHCALAPFDLGISQDFTLTASPSEIEGIDEITITAEHRSGTIADWVRSNKIFIRELRKQFLLWRTLSSVRIEQYRMKTLQLLGPDEDDEQALINGGDEEK